ncbi:hypothetical protein QYM36_016476, partial [Artemia franciscana]
MPPCSCSRSSFARRTLSIRVDFGIPKAVAVLLIEALSIKTMETAMFIASSDTPFGRFGTLFRTITNDLEETMKLRLTEFGSVKMTYSKREDTNELISGVISSWNVIARPNKHQRKCTVARARHLQASFLLDTLADAAEYHCPSLVLKVTNSFGTPYF